MRVLRLLTDASISPDIAAEVHRHKPACPIVSIQEWRGGQFLEERDDESILDQAHRDGFTLLTRDVTTIPLILMAESARQGVMARRVSDETVRCAIRRLGTSWKRAKRWINSPDPAYEGKKGVATG